MTVRRLEPRARRAAAVTAVVVVLLFLLGTWLVRHTAVTDLDREAKALIRDGRPAALDLPMRTISTLATGYVLLPITLACSVVLWRRRHHAVALWLPVIGMVAAVAPTIVKWLINKPRPSLRGYGFPSGHVFGATVFVIVIVYLLWRFDAPRRWRGVVRAAGIAFVTLVGYSRIYVNAHWLSDVVGGLLAGIAFALVIVLLIDGRPR